MNYYVPIAVSALICLIAGIIIIIFVRKCRKNQKEPSLIHHKERQNSANVGKGKPMHVTAVTQTDDVGWSIEDSSLLSNKKSPKNIVQPES